jgi:hypothetical protein
MENITALDWFYEKVKPIFERDKEAFNSLILTYEMAKIKEQEQVLKPVSICASCNEKAQTHQLCRGCIEEILSISFLLGETKENQKSS